MAASVLSGSLEAFGLPEVLTFLSESNKTGTLTLSNEGREAWLFFEEGSLVHAGSNQEQFRLGSILLRKKRISREDRERIDEVMRRDGGQFGQLAIQQGVLTEDQLRDFLKVQVSEIVYDIFVWNGGTFSFSRETALPSHAVTISVDLPNLIMEGARRIDEWDQCVKLLPDSSAVFRVVSAPDDDKIVLSADEWKVLFLINGVRSLEDLCHDSEEDPFHVYRVVYGLLSNRLIEPVPRIERDADETSSGTALVHPLSGDATMRQSAPSFGSESTVHDTEKDDSSLLLSSDARLSYSDVVRPTIARLRIQNGDASEIVVALTDGEYLIGRHRDNDIRLTDLGVSGFHARIYRGTEGYVVEDLKSRNGVWLNGTRVFHSTLANGDRLHFGQTDVLYELLM
jgi:hypothetical protein